MALNPFWTTINASPPLLTSKDSWNGGIGAAKHNGINLEYLRSGGRRVELNPPWRLRQANGKGVDLPSKTNKTKAAAQRKPPLRLQEEHGGPRDHTSTAGGRGV